jgi:hypothetical protein
VTDLRDCPINHIKFINKDWQKNYQISPLQNDKGNLYETVDFDGETLLAFSKKEDTRPIISTKVDQEPCMKQGDIGVTGTNKEMFYPTEKLLFKYQKSQAGP